MKHYGKLLGFSLFYVFNFTLAQNLTNELSKLTSKLNSLKSGLQQSSGTPSKKNIQIFASINDNSLKTLSNAQTSLQNIADQKIITFESMQAASTKSNLDDLLKEGILLFESSTNLSEDDLKKAVTKIKEFNLNYSGLSYVQDVGVDLIDINYDLDKKTIQNLTNIFTGNVPEKIKVELLEISPNTTTSALDSIVKTITFPYPPSLKISNLKLTIGNKKVFIPLSK